MEIKLKFISGYPDNVEEFFLVFDNLIANENWLEQIESSHRAFFPYAAYTIKNRQNDEVSSLAFDDTYGEVDFNIYIPNLTVEQLADHFTHENGIIYLFAKSGGVGGDKNYIAIAELAHIIYKNINGFVIENPLLYDLAKIVTGLVFIKGKDFIKSEKMKYIEASKLMDYLYSRDTWTLKRLETSFSYKNSENIINLMKLLGFQMNNEGVFSRIEDDIVLSEGMDNMQLNDQFKILIYYLEFKLNYNEFSIAGKQHLIKDLTVPISIEKLNDIIIDLDAVFLEGNIKSNYRRG